MGGIAQLKEKRALINKFKFAPCIGPFCKGKVFWHWRIMTCDHIRGEKLFNIRDVVAPNTGPNYRSHKINHGGMCPSHLITLEMLKAELEKCQPVCANCQAELTHLRTKIHRKGKCDCERVVLP